MHDDPTYAERFWSRVDRRGPEECWPWLGARYANGYGAASFGHGRTGVASRVAWALANDADVPVGLHVCHSCDNPPCCNPGHLWIGTRKQNAADMLAKGRHWAQKGLNPIPRGEASGSAKLTQAQVDEIRQRARTEKQSLILRDFPMIGNSQISNIVRGVVWK